MERQKILSNRPQGPLPLFSSCLIAFLCLTFLTSCGPSFPAETVSESVVKLCKEEYNLEAKAELYGHTLWTYLPLDYLVDKSLRLDPEIGEKVENIALCIHRVVTSTDAPIDFYVLVASDVSTVGCDYTLIGFVQDIKRVRLLDISRGDYLQRILRSLELNPRALGDKEGRHIQMVDISLERFLAEQICRRIKTQFEKDEGLKEQFLLEGDPRWEIRKDGIFRIGLIASSGKALWPAAGNKTNTKKALDEAAKVATKVFQGYRFKDFQRIEIVDLRTHQEVVLTQKDIFGS